MIHDPRLEPLSTVQRDNEGYLLDPDDWSDEIMLALASEQTLELTSHHMAVVQFVRSHYQESATVPEARLLIKHLRRTIGTEFATMRYLSQLFPYGYGQQACKIAGMRKPLKLMLDV